MTLEERESPAIINGSRRKRIAEGSGTSVAEVNKLLKQFDDTRKVMKNVAGGGARGAMQKMKSMRKK
jgi:signal recognition particle subunit SRP54